MRRLPFLPALFASLVGCGGGPVPTLNVTRQGVREPAAALAPLDRSRWMPESIDGGKVIEQLPDGSQRALVGRLRVEITPAGVLRRASDLLPATPNTTSLVLPDRLGGGFLFSAGGRFWRTREFLGRLDDIATVQGQAPIVTTGPDRLFVRQPGTDRIDGLDVETGAWAPPLPVPIAPRISAIAFADARRGFVFADLRGALITTDAGATWTREPSIPDASGGVTIENGLLVVRASTGRFQIDARGNVTRDARGDVVPTPEVRGAASADARKPPGPLGARPLRTAVEDGWPMPDGSALVARGGRLARVATTDGAILGSVPLPGEEDSACTVVRYAADVGLVCGAPGGGTRIYGFAPPLGVTLVASYASPRSVGSSGNGALVVRGPCDADASSSDVLRASAYCVLPATGRSREILTRGDVGIERVVALADGRVVIVIPPRGSSDGQLTFLPPAGPAHSHPLKLPDDAPALRRGLWLESFVDAGGGEIAGWVESGSSIQGVRIKLEDGTVVAGAARDDAQIALVGLTAFASLPREGKVQETLDGGMTWTPVELPDLGNGRVAIQSADRTTLRCGTLGCVVPFERATWLRVGWGPRADPRDLEDAEERPGKSRERSPRRPLSITCDTLRTETPPEEVQRPARPQRNLIRGAPEPQETTVQWTGFRGMPPPTLPAGNAGFSETTNGATARLYAWTPKGVGGARASRYVGRFFDRFEPVNSVRSTAVSVAPWHDEQAIADAMGSGGPMVVFHGLLDASGRAAILSGCHGGGRDKCDLYGFVQGRAVLPLAASAEEPFMRVMAPSSTAVWADETWFLSTVAPDAVTVFRITASRAQVLVRFPRVGDVSPRLVRRARSSSIGLLTTGRGVYGQSDSDFYLVPIDSNTGETGEMLRLGPTDLGGVMPRKCGAEEDGWVVDPGSATPVSVRLVPHARLADAEIRLRLEPGDACVEGFSARLQDAGVPAPPRGKPPLAPSVASAPPTQPAAGVPFVATHQGTDRRLVAICPLK